MLLFANCQSEPGDPLGLDQSAGMIFRSSRCRLRGCGPLARRRGRQEAGIGTISCRRSRQRFCARGVCCRR